MPKNGKRLLKAAGLAAFGGASFFGGAYVLLIGMKVAETKDPTQRNQYEQTMIEGLQKLFPTWNIQ